MNTATDRWQSSIWKHLGYSLFLAACLFAGIRPAQAGYYWVAPQTVTGSVTVTPVGGTPTTTDLSDTDGSYDSGGGFMGTISYSYSATYQYSWISDYDDESPVDQNLYLNGDSSYLNLCGTSNTQLFSGGGSASVSLLGSEHRFDGTNTAHDPDAPDYSCVETGSGYHSQTISLTGDEGTFTLTVTGSLDTGDDGVFSGQLQVAPAALPFTTVVFKKPAFNAHRLRNTNFQVVVKWATPVGAAPGLTVRVRIEVKAAGSTTYTLAALLVQPPGRSGTATTTISIATPGVADLQATLELVPPIIPVPITAGTTTTSVNID